MIGVYNQTNRCIHPLIVWLSTPIITTIIYIILIYENIIPIKKYDYIPVIICMVIVSLFILYNGIYHKTYKTSILLFCIYSVLLVTLLVVKTSNTVITEYDEILKYVLILIIPIIVIGCYKEQKEYKNTDLRVIKDYW